MAADPPISDYDPPRNRPRPLFRWFVIYPLLGLLAVVLLTPLIVSSFESLGSRRDLATERTLANLANLHASIDQFHDDTGRYPTTAEGFNALLTQPVGTAGWKGPYIKRTLLDGWGHSFIYRCPGTTNPDTFDLLSMGRDGIEGTDDDLTDDGG